MTYYWVFEYCSASVYASKADKIGCGHSKITSESNSFPESAAQSQIARRCGAFSSDVSICSATPATKDEYEECNY